MTYVELASSGGTMPRTTERRPRPQHRRSPTGAALLAQPANTFSPAARRRKMRLSVSITGRAHIHAQDPGYPVSQGHARPLTYSYLYPNAALHLKAESASRIGRYPSILLPQINVRTQSGSEINRRGRYSISPEKHMVRLLPTVDAEMGSHQSGTVTEVQASS